MRSSHVLAACAALLACGCSKILGLGDIAYVDASTDSPDGPTGMTSDCPAPPANTVIACATITHVRTDGTTFTTRKDLSPFTIAAYISDSSKSGFRIVSGVASSDGTARIEGVPDGTPFYFRIHNPQDPTYPWPHYFFTDKHTLEIGTAEIGRDDTPTTSETALTVNMTGMTPWKGGDSAELVSFEGGTQAGRIARP
ncbi:MAG TPA: hypothetical protein VLM79_27535, partial [Kofleriaceae bacterium]|nr:hypothetical protein [Kofleriaceae bacterium]